MWERLKIWLEPIHVLPDNDSPRLYLLGINTDNSYATNFVYFVSILTKMYIHTCKNINKTPTTQGLKKYIQRTETIERTIATGRGRPTLLKHLDKWTPFIENNPFNT